MEWVRQWGGVGCAATRRHPKTGTIRADRLARRPGQRPPARARPGRLLSASRPGRAPPEHARPRTGAPAMDVDPTAGRHTRRTARPRRARHWERPTTFLAVWNTSPGPRPAKHTISPNSPGTERPRCTSKPCCPRRARTSTHHAPTHSAAKETSATHSGSSLGIQASSQSWRAGSRYTAPPPPRRRASSTPRCRIARASTRSVGCVLPSTRVGPVISRASATRRGSDRNCSTSKSCCDEDNLRRLPPDTAPTAGPRQRGGAAATGARREERA